MTLLYFEEPDKAVWHIVRRQKTGRYLALCGWEMTHWHGRVWPVKAEDRVRPDRDAICHSCLAPDEA